jgi:O-acetyl-ADP-ribose deacetylase (regulator of RNase III)
MEDTRRRYPQGCPTGSAVISVAGELPARYVAHAVGPRWRGGKSGEAELLGSAIVRSLEVALEHDCRSVALPAISTGIYGYPLAAAAEVALSKAIAFLNEQRRPEIVRFVLFDERAFDTFAKALSRLTGAAAETTE